MQWYFQLQLIISTQDRSALSCLNILRPPFLNSRRFSLKIWSDAALVSSTAASVSDAIATVEANRCNYLEVTVPSKEAISGFGTIRSLDCVLRISPVNALWGSVPVTIEGSRRAKSLGLELRMQAEWVARFEYRSYPSLLDLAFQFDGQNDESTQRALIARVLSDVFESDRIVCDFVGAGDLRRIDDLVVCETPFDNVRASQEAYEMLKTRVDRIHDFIIADRDYCAELSRAIIGSQVYPQSLSPFRRALLLLPKEATSDPALNRGKLEHLILPTRLRSR